MAKTFILMSSSNMNAVIHGAFNKLDKAAKKAASILERNSGNTCTVSVVSIIQQKNFPNESSKRKQYTVVLSVKSKHSDSQYPNSGFKILEIEQE